MTKQSFKIAILGAGVSGFGASHRLRNEGIDTVLYEKEPYHGGRSASHLMDGYIFDEGPHVSYTKDDRLRKLFAESVHGQYDEGIVQVNNYWQGYWITHPAITNLHGLPSDLMVNILRDFIGRPNDSPDSIRNYEDWLIASYGRTYAETFPMQYTRKFHTTNASNMTTEWVGPRLYQANLEEVLLGALSPHAPNIHYVQEYRYPAQNGFVSFFDLFRTNSHIFQNYRVTKIDPRARELTFAHGEVVRYDHLISSIALPDLIPLIVNAPNDVIKASQDLACTCLVLVNIGVDRPDVCSENWTYFYDDDMPFSRVSFQRNISPSTVPEGVSAIQCEVYFSRKYKPLTQPPEAYIEPVIDGLRHCGLLREDDKILLRKAMFIPYANIIFDLDRPTALRTVHGFLDDIGIAHCGRYGDWGYLWTDMSFLSGESAAQRILDRITS